MQAFGADSQQHTTFIPNPNKREREKNKETLAFIDYEKAFNSVQIASALQAIRN